MPLPPTSLSVLATLDRPHSIAELADSSGRSWTTIRDAVQKLRRDHLITLTPAGREQIVRITSPTLAAGAKTLIFDIGRPDWDKVFHGTRPQVIHVLNRLGRAPLVAEVLGQSRRTIYQIVQDMTARGIVTREPKPLISKGRTRVDTVIKSAIATKATKYRINPRLTALAEFLEEVDEVTAHGRLVKIDPHARVLWHLGPELLYCSEAPDHDEGLGGPSALANFGIELLTSRTYYHKCVREPTASDAILQTLLVDPPSKVNRSYAAVAYEKIKPDDLIQKAIIYGLENEAILIMDYVNNQGQTEGSDYFLPWESHERYRTQYEV